MSDHTRRPEHGHEDAAIGWVLHALGRDEEVDFLVHLETCPECRRTVSETSAAMSSVGGALPQDDPPPRLRDTIMAAVAVEPEPPRRREEPASEGSSSSGSAGSADDGTVVPMRRRGSRVRRFALVAAVAVLVAAVGGLVAANRSLTQERDAQAAQAERVSTMLRDAARPGAVHATLADPGGALVGMVVDIGSGPRVMTTGLADNRTDETYVLWVVAGGQPRPVGTFDVSGSAPYVRSVGSVDEAGRAAGYAVSLEPGRSAPTSPTRIVASGQVGR